MDFNIKKPSHIFALIALIVAFGLVIVLPIFSFFYSFPSTEMSQIGDMPDSFQSFFEIFILIFYLIFMMGLFIGVPLVWYFLVNKFSLKKMFSRLKLRKEGIDLAVLWGVVGAIAAFGIILIIGILLEFLGFNISDSSNIRIFLLFLV